MILIDDCDFIEAQENGQQLGSSVMTQTQLEHYRRIGHQIQIDRLNERFNLFGKWIYPNREPIYTFAFNTLLFIFNLTFI